jgi:DNA polymerase-4
MVNRINLPFNPKPPTCLHIDLNSCFATIEQQANPLFRNKPVAVAAYTTPSGCILAPSVEAKRMGIQVGMRVKEGKMICPSLIVLPPDPWKYRSIHLNLKQLLSGYTDNITPKSIDEFVLDLEGYPAYERGMEPVAKEIKQRIRREVGDWLTVSIGIGPNRFLAKTAAGLHKPDGLDLISTHNYRSIYESLELTDLCGIKTKNMIRLNRLGIFSVMDFFEANSKTLIGAFESIVGYYWYLRLHGWEIDDVLFGRRSFGNSYALPQPLTTKAQIAPILMKLTQKMSQRLRRQGYYAQGVHVSFLFRDGTHWHMGRKNKAALFETAEIYRSIIKLYQLCPYRKPVTNLAVSCFNLVSANKLQLDFFTPLLKQERLSQAVDNLNHKWGDYVVTPALMLNTSDKVPDRIAFGGMKELEELVLT